MTDPILALRESLGIDAMRAELEALRRKVAELEVPRPEPTGPAFLTTEEIAARWRCHPKTAARRIRRAGIGSKDGGRWVVARAELEAHERRQGHQTKS